jgi:hypothetical protein
MQAYKAHFEGKRAFLHFTKIAKMVKNTENTPIYLKRKQRSGNLYMLYACKTHPLNRSPFSASYLRPFFVKRSESS